MIQIIKRLEENHKFLVIETPRSVLFFNYVISSFANPKQNKTRPCEQGNWDNWMGPDPWDQL